MSEETLETPIGLLTVLHPAAMRPLRELGFDLAIEHDRSFADACAMRDLDPEFVWTEVLEAEMGDATSQNADWAIIQPLVTREAEWSPSAYLPAPEKTVRVEKKTPAKPVVARDSFWDSMVLAPTQAAALVAPQ